MKQLIRNWLGITHKLDTTNRYCSEFNDALIQIRARIETLENEAAASTLKLFHGLSERIAVLELYVDRKIGSHATEIMALKGRLPIIEKTATPVAKTAPKKIVKKRLRAK